MEKPAFSFHRLGSLLHREPSHLPNIDSIPEDQEIVLFSSERPTYEANVPRNDSLPNPFLTSHLVEAIRRERQAENETGE